jgi:hypothetical protein
MDFPKVLGSSNRGCLFCTAPTFVADEKVRATYCRNRSLGSCTSPECSRPSGVYARRLGAVSPRRLLAIRLLPPDEQLDGFCIGDDLARCDSALIRNVEFCKTIEQQLCCIGMVSRIHENIDLRGSEVTKYSVSSGPCASQFASFRMFMI